MRLRTLLAGLCIAVVASACGSNGSPTGPGPIVTPPPDPGPPPTPAPPTLGITRILSFGDSMTEGTTQPVFVPLALTAGKSESYPFKLQTLLSARYTAQTITVSNAGHAGENATGTNPSTRDRLSGALADARPELVILMEGANDLNSMSNAGLTDVSPVVAAMEDMVRDALGRGSQVMVATLPPQRAGGRNAGGIGLLGKYNSQLKTMAATKGAMLVDFNAQIPLSLIGQDGLHPTEEGYQLFAQIFFDAIKARYEAATTTTAATAARR